MKMFCLAVGLLVGSLYGVAQPEIFFGVPQSPVQVKPIDDYIIQIENHTEHFETLKLNLDTLTDSLLYFKPYSPYSPFHFEQNAVPYSFKPELVISGFENEIVKITFGNHTFHFREGALLRSWVHCSQVTAMGQCGGFVTTSNAVDYWNGSRVYRSISWYSHPHPCGCYQEKGYGYDIIMELYKMAEEYLKAKVLIEGK